MKKKNREFIKNLHSQKEALKLEVANLQHMISIIALDNLASKHPDIYEQVAYFKNA